MCPAPLREDKNPRELVSFAHLEGSNSSVSTFIDDTEKQREREKEKQACPVKVDSLARGQEKRTTGYNGTARRQPQAQGTPGIPSPSIGPKMCFSLDRQSGWALREIEESLPSGLCLFKVSGFYETVF